MTTDYSAYSDMPDYDTFFKDAGWQAIRAKQDQSAKNNYYGFDELVEEETAYNAQKKKEWDALLASKKSSTPTAESKTEQSNKSLESSATTFDKDKAKDAATVARIVSDQRRAKIVENVKQKAERAKQQLVDRLSRQTPVADKSSVTTAPKTTASDLITRVEQLRSAATPPKTTASDLITRADQRRDEILRGRLGIAAPAVIAGSLSGQRNYNEPVRPLNQSPQGPSTPVRYDPQMRMFVPSRPTQTGRFYLG